MIKRYRFGKPFFTDAVPAESAGYFSKGDIDTVLESCAIPLKTDENKLSETHAFAEVQSKQADTNKHSTLHLTTTQTAITLSMPLGEDDRIYGLGENVRGINKRGWKYISYCADDMNHHEDKKSLYGAHNFITLTGSANFGLFIDHPGRVTFDIGYSDTNLMTIEIPSADADIYVITPENTGFAAKDIVHQFRRLIGKSYKAPRWAFGYGQSRWGYRTAEDIRRVADGYAKAQIPLDMIYLDIDYMTDYKDFTVDPEKFPNFPDFVAEMKARKIHLIPIIDAGVKEEPGYETYDEGKAGGFFCKDADGKDFTVAVWPGRCYFPDFLNSRAREWFGKQYKKLTDAGIDGFWNDMNEPAIFYSTKQLEQAFEKIKTFENKNIGIQEYFELTGLFGSLSNSDADYKALYHTLDDGSTVCHDEVHNLFGYNMTRAASEEFEHEGLKDDTLIFSRASYIGAHRYGGIWQGDNKSWWSHIELNLRMLPSLNMCGFLYTGADLGGFGENTTEDLMLRWLALGIFTPLMRNHAALGTREQELYRFKQLDAFRNLINIRHHLVPYLYATYCKAIDEDLMMFRPLAFDYPDDRRAVEVEDELMLGDELLIAPVMKQNASGRMVYLPENMRPIRFTATVKVEVGDVCDSAKCSETGGTASEGGNVCIEVGEPKCGDVYVEVPLDEVVLFIKDGYELPF